jgi:hypothetical protein
VAISLLLEREHASFIWKRGPLNSLTGVDLFFIISKINKKYWTHLE